MKTYATRAQIAIALATVIGLVNRASGQVDSNILEMVRTAVAKNFHPLRSLTATVSVTGTDPEIDKSATAESSNGGATLNVTRLASWHHEVKCVIQGGSARYDIESDLYGDMTVLVANGNATSFSPKYNLVTSVPYESEAFGAMPAVDPREPGFILASERLAGLLHGDQLVSVRRLGENSTEVVIDAITDTYGIRLFCRPEDHFLPHQILYLKLTDTKAIDETEMTTRVDVVYSSFTADSETVLLPSTVVTKTRGKSKIDKPDSPEWSTVSTQTREATSVVLNSPIDEGLFRLPKIPPGTGYSKTSTDGTSSFSVIPME